ncbi:DUF3017 domain-containing protein [Corynebacterium freiburgense]|uniref:DUF3017 domain-containing protein n=1 Tax=Corynebacterium freiburgense TaxID=556548 RepID=UPI000479B1AA|nr:DUF3017 domain-containing protein [Corynebacterium freiburgense]WJZ01790.1 hypothetical protein CFREI_02430 [Corynebacterium freiburgense]
MSVNPHDSGNQPSSLPLRFQRVGLAIFVAGLIAACGFLATEHWRRSTFTLGCCLLWLAGLRLSCDSETLGVLAVRSQRFDAVFCSAIGGAMMFLAGTVDSLGS